MRRNPIHLFFPAFAREFIFFLRDDHPSLFLCPAEYSRGRSGFPKRARFVRERERDKLWMWFPISPGREKREREDQRLMISPTTKRSARKERKKKTNRQPKHNISKKERERAFEEKERERERECFFKRKERHFSSFLSLLSLTSPEGGAS